MSSISLSFSLNPRSLNPEAQRAEEPIAPVAMKVSPSHGVAGLQFQIHRSLEQSNLFQWHGTGIFASIAEVANQFLLQQSQFQQKLEHVTLFKGKTRFGHDAIVFNLRTHGQQYPRMFLGKGGYKKYFAGGLIEIAGQERINVAPIAIAKPLAKGKAGIQIIDRAALADESLPESKDFIRVIMKISYLSASGSKNFLVFPLAQNTILDVLNYLSRNEKIDVAATFLRAISTLHGHKRRHGDVKLDNCLEREHGVFQLSDADFSSDFKFPCPKAGTLECRSPELLAVWNKPDELSDQGEVDTWAAAVTLCELFVHKNVFNKDLHLLPIAKGTADPASLRPVIVEFFEKYQNVFESYHPRLSTILRSCLVVDPEKRSSIDKAWMLFQAIFPKSK